jgi:hypothetical protein
MADGARTSGMVALVPSADDVDKLAIGGGEDPGELHLTLAYLGDDVSQLSPQERNGLAGAILDHAQNLAPITARVMGHASFNPDGGAEGDMDPCAVYLVGDSPTIPGLHDDLATRTSAEQHTPFIPHVTAGYGKSAGDLSYSGPVTFDRMRLALGDQAYDFPLGGVDPDAEDDDAEEDLADGGADEAAEGEDPEDDDRIFEDDGVDPEDDDYGLKGLESFRQYETKRVFSSDRRKKLALSGHAMSDGSYPIETVGDLSNAIRSYGEAPAAKRPAVRAHIVKSAKKLGARKMIPTKWPEHPANKGKKQLTVAEIEQKVASPDPRAAKLRKYWAHNPKARAKWQPGVPGDFNRLRTLLAKYVHDPHILAGLTANIHKMATGAWPGHEKSVRISVAQFKAALAMADPDAEQPSADVFADLGSVDEDAGERGDDAPDEDPDDEDAYEQALADEVDWNITPDGVLVEGGDTGAVSNLGEDEDEEDDPVGPTPRDDGSDLFSVAGLG